MVAPNNNNNLDNSDLSPEDREIDEQSLFPLGQVVATPAAVNAMVMAGEIRGRRRSK